MERDEAGVILKEVLRRCPRLNVTKVLITHPDTDDALSRDNQLCLTAILDAESRKSLKNILEKYELAIKEEPEKIIIYKQQQIKTI